MASDSIKKALEDGEFLGKVMVDLKAGRAISEEERKRLDELIAADPAMGEIFAGLDEPEFMGHELEAYEDIVGRTSGAFEMFAEEAFEQEKTAFEGPAARRFRPMMVAVSVAAGLVLIGSVFVLYRIRGARAVVPAVAVVRDVAPGSDKAVLTLGNGSTIVLDSTHNGSLGNQGGAEVVNHADGKLSYTGAVDARSRAAVFNSISTPKGGQYQLTLADGTKVWLDAGSSLRYPTTFSDLAVREVELKGQAYFSVAHSRERFVVRAAGISVEDLGTTFNVKAYSDEDRSQATLVSGVVRVSGRVLTPGEMADVSNTGAVKIRHVDTSGVTAWRSGMFVFDHTDLQEGMREIGRWYDVEIVYEGQIPAGRQMVGSASRNEYLSVLVHLLNLSGIKCRLEGKNLIVNP